MQYVCIEMSEHEDSSMKASLFLYYKYFNIIPCICQKQSDAYFFFLENRNGLSSFENVTPVIFSPIIMGFFSSVLSSLDSQMKLNHRKFRECHHQIKLM